MQTKNRVQLNHETTIVASEIRDELFDNTISGKGTGTLKFKETTYFSPILVEQDEAAEQDLDYKLAVHTVTQHEEDSCILDIIQQRSSTSIKRLDRVKRSQESCKENSPEKEETKSVSPSDIKKFDW